jgi:pimeloyl-ACP methyl ester carboxylesterase
MGHRRADRIGKVNGSTMLPTRIGAAQGTAATICVHGLSRQGRDFDYLAAALSKAGRRVICPDLVGRGRSGRLRNPEGYALPQFAPT